MVYDAGSDELLSKADKLVTSSMKLGSEERTKSSNDDYWPIGPGDV